MDLEKEKARVEKELKKNSAELDKLNAKLANPGFVNKAPPTWWRRSGSAPSSCLSW